MFSDSHFVSLISAHNRINPVQTVGSDRARHFAMTSSGEELPTEEIMEDDLPPLLLAAKEGDVAAFKKMVEDGDDVLQKDEVRNRLAF